MKSNWSRQDADWEAHLAAALKAAAAPDDPRGPAESDALARRLDAALRADRAARSARVRRTWLSLAAAAACAAVVALAAWHGTRSARSAALETATAETPADTAELSIADARLAPVSDAFGELEEVLTELAALDFNYEWDDEDL